MISYQFTMKVGPTPGKIIQLMKPELTIGRDLANDIVISDADVSRHHAQLTRKGDTYLLEDLGSTNGTYVNGQRLTSPQILQPADQIRLGEAVMLIFETLAFDAQPVSVESQPEVAQPAPVEAPIAPLQELVPPSPADNLPAQSPESAPPQQPASLAASLLGAMNKTPAIGAPAEVAPPVVPEAGTPVAAAQYGDFTTDGAASFEPTAAVKDDSQRVLKIGLIMGGVALVLLCLCAAVGLLAYLIFLE